MYTQRLNKTWNKQKKEKKSSGPTDFDNDEVLLMTVILPVMKLWRIILLILKNDNRKIKLIVLYFQQYDFNAHKTPQLLLLLNMRKRNFSYYLYVSKIVI